jgi:predicted patatin/cPLA2 family phospholipase
MRLVLAGGGMRGAFTAGVLEELAKAQLPWRAVVGSSAGAINGAFFVSGQVELMKRVWLEYLPTRRFISKRRMLWGRPMMDVDDLVNDVIVRDYPLDVRAVTEGKIAFHLNATDIRSGECVVERPTAANLHPWLRATAAIPIAYHRTVTIDGRELADGSLSAPLPWDLASDGSDEEVVMVFTRVPETRQNRYPGWLEALFRWTMRRELSPLVNGYPDVYNREIERALAAEREGRLTLIHPVQDLGLTRASRDREAIVTSMAQGAEVGRAFVEGRLRRKVC